MRSRFTFRATRAATFCSMVARVFVHDWGSDVAVARWLARTGLFRRAMLAAGLVSGPAGRRAGRFTPAVVGLDFLGWRARAKWSFLLVSGRAGFGLFHVAGRGFLAGYVGLVASCERRHAVADGRGIVSPGIRCHSADRSSGGWSGILVNMGRGGRRDEGLLR